MKNILWLLDMKQCDDMWLGSTDVDKVAERSELARFSKKVMTEVLRKNVH